jgi:hypothetical protein
MGRQGPRLTQVDREHVNEKANRLVMYKHHAILYTMHMDGWNDNVRVYYVVNKQRNVVPHLANAFSATTCTAPSPRFKATLSDSESTKLSPTSIDSAHGGKASLLTQSDAILSARTPDLDARSTRAGVAHLGGANHDLRQLDLDHIGDPDCDRLFSPDFAGCCVAE